MTYPANKQDLVKKAKEKGADEDIIRVLESLPVDRFSSPNQVTEAASKVQHAA
jgi:hypothetical protein